MSKKTIPFPTAVLPPSRPRQSAADSRSADVEDWVQQKIDEATPEGVAEPVSGHSRGLAFVLSDDATWLELLSFTCVLPAFAISYWINRASQKAIRQLSR
jgi:hypothetical protein